MEIELATGWTWLVAYRFDGEEPEVMLVRAITPEKALEEAHYSLDTGFLNYQIYGIVRDDMRGTLS